MTTTAPPGTRGSAQYRATPTAVPARTSAPAPADPQAPPVHLVTTLIGALAVLAASMAIPPMITGDNWFWPTVEVVMVIWLVGVGARLARIPAAAAILLQAAGVAVALTALFTVGGIGGVLPNGAALSEAGELLTGAWQQIRTTVSPAPASTELAFLITVSIGATALIVDILIAVCKAPALVALPLLCVYSVPASIDLGMLPWEAFAAPALLYALLLTADGLSGRRLGAGAGTAQVVSGVALASLATVVALVVAASVTAVGTTGRLPRTASGPSSTIGLSPFASLQGNLQRSDPVDMLRVSGLDTPQYLRTVGLQKWTAGEGWSVDDLADGALPDAPVDAGSPEITVTPLGYRDQFLPIYDGTSSVDGVGQGWSYDAALESVHRPDPVSPSPYRVAVAFPESTADQLRADTVTVGGPLTETGQLPEEAVQVAQRVTAQAQTPFDKADALRTYFTDSANGFSYSLSVPQGDSGDYLVDFLRNKQGYCEQYASAMAILLRAVGVPARVAIGFTQGTVEADGSYLISSNDAHAWVEVRFDNAGWVQFDPTPLGGGQGGQQGFTETEETSPSASAAPETLPSAQLPDDGPTLGEDGAAAQLPDEAQTAAGGAPESGRGVSPVLWWTLAVLVLLAAAAAGPTVVRNSRRTSRLAIADAGGPDAAAAAWRELEDLAIDHGVALNPAESARATANRLSKTVHLDDRGRAELRAVVTRAERGWYGASTIDSPETGVTATLERPATGSLGDAPRTIAKELARVAPLSPIERLVPRSVRPGWWRD